jgi:hypothetical protein
MTCINTLTPSPPPRLLLDRILCQLFDWHQFSLTKVKLACEIVPDSRRNSAQQILLCRCTVRGFSPQSVLSTAGNFSWSCPVFLDDYSLWGFHLITLPSFVTSAVHKAPSLIETAPQTSCPPCWLQSRNNIPVPFRQMRLVPVLVVVRHQWWLQQTLANHMPCHHSAGGY